VMQCGAVRCSAVCSAYYLLIKEEELIVESSSMPRM
jgi:hypothetical protein